MMRLRGAMAIFLAGAAGALLTGPVGAANSDEYGGAFACPGREIAGVGRAYLPSPLPLRAEQLPLDRLPLVRHLNITDAGAIAFEGKPASPAQLPELLRTATANPRTQILIQPGKQTPFHTVVAAVAMLNTLKFCDFGFAGNERWGMPEYYSKRDAIASGLTAPPVPPFVKVSDEAMLLDYGPSASANGKRGRSTCRILLRGKPVDFDEAVSLSFNYLGSAVKRMGGIEGVKRLYAEQGLAAVPVAIVQAKASLPWHCAAGAIYAAQISGYPLVDLVILPD